jgi:molybdate transport system substrate-binding protein
MYFMTKVRYLVLISLFGIILSFGGGCSKKEEPLVVYAGKGLKYAMDEVKHSFEQKRGIPVSIKYAGSNSLLTTLKTTHKGDIFIPGSISYLNKAGKLVTSAQFVAYHVPTFLVQANNSKNIHSYSDLLAPGVKIAVGNKDTCAIGKVGSAILSNTAPEESFQSNIVITGSTVNELLNLVVEQEVDAALIWRDMLNWDKSKGLKGIALPKKINKTKEVHVATLSTTTSLEHATLFANFVAIEGRAIFVKHGFIEK